MTVFKNILNDIKLNKISYLLEVIETGDFKKKVDAYNKLRKKKLDEESGHIIIDKVSSLEKGTIDDFNIEISLLTLLFKNYYDSYSDHLFEIYKKLNTNTKYELLNLLSTSDEPTELILYRRLISNYYKELDSFPIGNISANKDNYSLLFPELYETFKTKKSRNNILLLLNDFINYGVVPINHLKKYKQVQNVMYFHINMNLYYLFHYLQFHLPMPLFFRYCQCLLYLLYHNLL